ncbi:MAG TPA: phosphate ABC transporter permease subunit PstC [bacterium]
MAGPGALRREGGLALSHPGARRVPSPAADRLFRAGAGLCALSVLLILVLLVATLAWKSLPAIRRFGPAFLWSDAWNPVTGTYGALSSIVGTLASTLIALALAVPLSLTIAFFLVELAPPAVSRPVGLAIELLAAVPSIIYGMWGLYVFAPLVSRHVQPALARAGGGSPFFGGPQMGIGVLTAGLILALMVLPFMTAVIRDVFSLVPHVVKEAAYGLGATTWEVARQVTLRYGLHGVIGAVVLGLGRAIGETMAVTFVIGNEHRLSLSLFAPGNTIASTLANEFSEASDPLHVSALVALGAILLLLSAGVQCAAQLWLSRVERRSGAAR